MTKYVLMWRAIQSHFTSKQVINVQKSITTHSCNTQLSPSID